MALDLNRPFTSRKHPSGVRIYMHFDTPGAYFDESGRPVAHKLARAAGFRVDRDLIDRDKKHRLDSFRQELEQEFAGRSEELDRAAALCDEEFRVTPMGAGGFKVERDGQLISEKSLSIGEAEELVEGLRDGEDETNGATVAAEKSGAGAAPGGGEAAAAGSDGGLSDLM